MWIYKLCITPATFILIYFLCNVNSWRGKHLNKSFLKWNSGLYCQLLKNGINKYGFVDTCVPLSFGYCLNQCIQKWNSWASQSGSADPINPQGQNYTTQKQWGPQWGCVSASCFKHLQPFYWPHPPSPCFLIPIVAILHFAFMLKLSCLQLYINKTISWSWLSFHCTFCCCLFLLILLSLSD